MENTLEMTEGAVKIRSVLTDLYDLLGSNDLGHRDTRTGRV